MKKKRTPANRRRTGVKKLRGGLDPSVGKATQFKPGESGNPSGHPKEKPILEALRENLTERPELAKQIALEALKQAKHQLGWFQEIRDMLDGKPEDGKPTGRADDPVNFNLHVGFVKPKN